MELASSAPVGRTLIDLPGRGRQGLNVLRPNKQTTVATLQQQRCSQREIERVRGIDRKTIRTYQLRFEAELANSPRGGHRV